MTTHARQPFAALDGTRLNNLTSMKNRQNALSTLSSPGKASLNTLTSPTKRRYSPSTFEDDFDAENIDPSIFASPTKRAKNCESTTLKSSKLILTDATTSPKPASSVFSSFALSEKRKTSLSVSLPSTTNATPISQSRGSPKHKRIGLLSKRRASSSPFRRVEPPSFMSSNPSAGAPFSIDAALSGTISSYAPKAACTLDESMPKSWFFDIHEDTPEEEAANLMEHSALCLDISSDDDEETKRQNLEKEKGKENVPPPEFFVNASRVRSAGSTAEVFDAAAMEFKQKRAKRFEDLDKMIEDRKALGDLNAADFYPNGCDEASVVLTAEEGEEHHVQSKSSGLFNETKADDVVEESITVTEDVVIVIEQEAAQQEEEKVQVLVQTEEVKIWVDESVVAEEGDNIA